jgi:pilus assembly protein CpaE
MEDVARVVLALEAHDVAEEVMHFLDRSGCARVVATAGDDRQLEEAARQLEPDAVVAQPSLVGAETLRGRAWLALDTRESVAGLRSAIRGGAEGFFVWPAERDELVAATARTVVEPLAEQRRAKVIAVYGPRGGVGATFVATHLAAAFARRGEDCILLDADPAFGDVAAAVGAPASDGGRSSDPAGVEPTEVRTLGDVLPLVDELTPRHLDGALWTHQEGFRILLPPPPQEALSVRADDLRRIAEVSSSAADVVVVHLPRAMAEASRAGVDIADRVLVVLSLDVMSFRDANRAVEAFRPFGLDGRVGFIVNRAVRAEIAPKDVERVFGVPAFAVLPRDRGVGRAQDHGKLLPSRGRTGRAIENLARRLLEELP